MVVENPKRIYVLEIIELPYKRANKYVCVPDSWIKLRSSKDRKVFVAYPIEDPGAVVRNRVEDNEPPGRDWKHFTGVIKYETDNYNDADLWIRREYSNRTADEEMIIVDEDETTDGNHETEHHSRYETPDTESRGIQSATSMKPHSSGITKNITKPQMVVAPVRNNQNSRLESSDWSMSRSPEKMYLEKQNFFQQTRPQYESESNLYRTLDYDNLLPIYKHFVPQLRETVVGNFSTDDIYRSTTAYLSNTSNRIDATPLYSNQSHPALERQYQPRISVVSEDFLRYGLRRQEPDPYRSKDPEITPAVHSFINLLRWQSQYSQNIHSSLNENLNHEIHGIHRSEQPSRIDLLNYIGQRAHRPNVSGNKSTAVQNSINSANIPRPVPKRLQKKQDLQGYKENLTQNPGVTRMSVIKSPESLLNVAENQGQCIKMNTPSPIQNLSQAADQPGQSHSTQTATAYNILVQKDSQVNKIIITKSTEIENNDPKAQVQNITSFAEQNFLKVAKQLCQRISNNYSSEKQFAPILADQTQQNSSAKNIVIRTTAGNPINLSRNKSTNFSCATQTTPRTANQFTQISESETLNKNNTSADLQNDERQAKSSQRFLAGESSAANRICQKPGLRSIKRNSPSRLPSHSSNHPHQFSENSHSALPLPNPSTVKDQRSKLRFLRKSTEISSHDHRPYFQKNNQNIAAVHTIPTSDHPQDRFMMHSYDNQYLLDYQNEMNKASPQSIPQDIPSPTVNPLTSATKSYSSCKCSRGKQLSPNTLSYSFQRHPCQGSLICRSSEADCYRQRVDIENNTVLRSLVQQNAQPNTHDLPANKYVSQSVIDQNPCPQSCKYNKMSAQNVPHSANQLKKHLLGKRHSSIDEDSSDQAISINEIPGVINLTTTKQCSRLENETEKPSIAKQNQSNEINESNGIREKPDDILMNDLKSMLLKMTASASAQYKINEDIRNATIEFDKLLTQMSDLINQTLDSVSKRQANSQNNQKTSTEESNGDAIIGNVEIGDADNIRSDMNEFTEPPKKKIASKTRFVCHQETENGH